MAKVNGIAEDQYAVNKSEKFVKNIWQIFFYVLQ